MAYRSICTLLAATSAPRAMRPGLACLATLFLAACSSSSSSTGVSMHDAGHEDAKGSHADASKDAKGVGDVGIDAGPPGLTCGKLLGCDQPCTTTKCSDACYAEASGVAQGIFNAFDDCISAHCPTGSASSCSESAATGACVSLLLACEGDKTVGPADPDGGAVVPVDAGSFDAAKPLNCGELASCEAACASGDSACEAACVKDSTAEAQSLENTLSDCLAKACPAGDGGTCEQAGSACTGCRTQAEFDQGVCGKAFSTCQADSSNAGDAGTFPVALTGGTLATIVSGLDQPQVVIVQGADVYYSQITATGAVSRAALTDAGTAATLSASQPYPMGLAKDADNLYVWNSGSFSGSTTVNQENGSVVQIPLAGGAPLTLATKLEAAYAAPYLNAIAVADKQVYWVAGASGDDGVIMTTAAGTVGGTALYSHQAFPEAVVTDGTDLYWANWGTFDASGNYNDDGSVLKGSIHGGTATTLATGQAAPAALAVDGNYVYWTNAGKLGGDNLPAPGTGSVVRVPTAGGTAVTLAKAEPIPLGLAVAGDTVYWTEYTLSGPGQIVSAPVGGGAKVALVGGLQNPFGLTVAGKTIVWSDSPPTAAGSGKILALTLP